MAQNMDERTAIEQSTADLRESKKRLEEQRDALLEQIATKEKLLRYWEERLSQLDGDPGNSGQRLRKGEPLRRILAVFESRKPADGLSTADIASESTLGWSTARGTLNRHSGRFIEREGLWYLKASE